MSRAWLFGDNVDTDAIIPARYLNTHDPKELAHHCMEDARDDFASGVGPGDVIIAGRNFGCGSSREHAPWALEASGIHLVIAENHARIFRQNMFNCGMMAVELPKQEIDHVFEHCSSKNTTVITHIDRKVFHIKADSFSEASHFMIPVFDHTLVMAGGWLEHADSKY